MWIEKCDLLPIPDIFAFLTRSAFVHFLANYQLLPWLQLKQYLLPTSSNTLMCYLQYVNADNLVIHRIILYPTNSIILSKWVQTTNTVCFQKGLLSILVTIKPLFIITKTFFTLDATWGYAKNRQTINKLNGIDKQYFWLRNLVNTSWLYIAIGLGFYM